MYKYNILKDTTYTKKSVALSTKKTNETTLVNRHRYVASHRCDGQHDALAHPHAALMQCGINLSPCEIHLMVEKRRYLIYSFVPFGPW